MTERQDGHEYAALVTTEWLAAHIDDPNVKLIDGSWYLPTENRDGEKEFYAGHIPGAVYFDVNAIADTGSSLPHMFPSSQKFAQCVGALGISNEDHVIAYGGNQTSACRVWWMFKAFGHDTVSVLDGGFGKWRAENRAIQTETPEICTQAFSAYYEADMVRDLDHIMGLVEGANKGEQILDARAAGRFAGKDPEPRPGMRAGHMPGAYNLPYNLLLEDNCFKADDALSEIVGNCGIDPSQPIVTSCGSGMSATVLLFALGRLGHRQLSLYDGSWSEWGGRDDTPIDTLPA